MNILRKLTIFLPELHTKMLWYWSVHSCHLQTTSVNLWRNSWIPPSTLCLHFELCFALQMVNASPVSLCHGKISVCLKNSSSLSILCKVLFASVGSSHVCYIFLLKCFCHLSYFFMQKSWYFKTLWIYKTLKMLLCQKMGFSDINSHLM